MAPKRSGSGSGASVVEVTDVLRPFVVSKRWLSYGESTKSPLKRLLLLSHSSMLSKVLALDHNPEIGTAKAAFTAIVADKMVEFRLTEAQAADWACAMSKRLKTMLFHLRQARSKESSWALPFFDAAAPPGPDDLVEDEEEEEEEGEAGLTPQEEEDDEEHEGSGLFDDDSQDAVAPLAIADLPAAPATPATRQPLGPGEVACERTGVIS